MTNKLANKLNVRILHLSDLHLSLDTTLNKFNQDVVLESMIVSIDELNSDKIIDFIVITGDLTYSGKKEEFDLVSKFIDKLTNKLKLEQSRIFVVPGNHDLTRENAEPRFLREISSFKEDIDYYLQNNSFKNILNQKFRNYYEFISKHFEHINYSGEFSYTSKLKVGKLTFNIIGLNSSIFAGYNGDDNNKLALGLTQVKDIYNSSKIEKSYNITLIHHPFNCFHQKDKVSKNQVYLNSDLILTGHLHDIERSYLLDSLGKTALLSNGASYFKRVHSNSFTIIDLNFGEGIGKAFSQKYISDYNTWILDLETLPFNDNGIFKFPVKKIDSTNQSETEKKDITLRINTNNINSFGIKLFNSLTDVLFELLSNSWDADATKVDIKLPTGSIDSNSKIVISDDGSGMSFEDINSYFLVIGRSIIDEISYSTTSKDRRILATSGLGIFSLFSIANEIIVTTIKNKIKNQFKLIYTDILNSQGIYYPEHLIVDKKVNEKSGTKIELNKLKRKSEIDVESISLEIKRRFPLISDDFVVKINGEQITKERTDYIELEYKWTIDEIIKSSNNWKIGGLIGTSKIPLDSRKKNIYLYSNGRKIHEFSLSYSKFTNHVINSYLWGELNIYSLSENKDFLLTPGEILTESSKEWLELENWFDLKINNIVKEWTNFRKRKTKSTIKSRIKELTDEEKVTIDEIINEIESQVDKPRYNLEQLIISLKTQLNYPSFADLSSNINEIIAIGLNTLEKILVIKKFEELILTDSREMPTIHRFLKDFPWLIDARITNLRSEVSYSEILKERFPKDEKIPIKNRRMDFIAVGFNNILYIIELKRPSYKIGKRDLLQIQDYIAFTRAALLGTDPNYSYRDVHGILICGGIQMKTDVIQLMNMLANNQIYIRTFNELLASAKNIYKDQISSLEKSLDKNK